MDLAYGEIRMERLGPMRVASYFVTSKQSEKEAASFLKSWMKRNGIFRTHQETRTFFLEVGGEQGLKQEFTGYEYWIIVPANASESEGVIIKDVPAGDYAVMRIYGPFCDDLECVFQGWKNLHDWVINSKYKTASGTHNYLLEEIIENEHGRCLDIYYPVKAVVGIKSALPELVYRTQDDFV